MKAEAVKALAEALEKLGYDVRKIEQDVHVGAPGGSYVIEVHLVPGAAKTPAPAMTPELLHGRLASSASGATAGRRRARKGGSRA
jgi:hypothetical protein